MNLKEKLRNYFKKKSKFSIASDVVFVLLLIALAFPSSRMLVVSTVQRITLFAPSAEKEGERKTLNEASYQWQFKTLDGKEVNLASFQNEVIFLNFWATWCPPCVAEMPSIQKLYDDYEDKVAFLLVTNEEAQTVSRFMQKKGLDMPVYLNQYQLPDDLSTSTIPTTYILSKNGDIVMEKEGAARWNSSKVRNLLEELVEK